VICQIAYEELKPEIKARVDALVAIDPKFRTFADACTAPDHPHIRTSARPSIMWTCHAPRKASRLLILAR
jgi:hypothetical protein